jgi:hypothetical protein
MVLDTMKENALDTLPVYSDLTRLLENIQSAGSVAALCDLTDTVHDLGHRLCDALEVHVT